MKRVRGIRLTSQPKGRLRTTMPTSVAVNSQGRFSSPPEMPIWSRIGRIT